MSLRTLMPGDMPNNGGYYRPITVVARPGSIFNHQFPAACAARGATTARLIDAIFGALAQALPDRVGAASDGGSVIVSMGGYRANGDPFIFVEPIRGAWGARPDLDAPDGAVPLSATRNSPVEMVETEYPLRVERYGFEIDTSGVGQYRGGVAVTRSIRLLAPDAILNVRADRQKFPPYGLQGGGPGAPSRTTLEQGGKQRLMPSKFSAQIRAGDLITITTAGGGGFGHPRDRDRAATEQDVLNGKLSAGQALREYPPEGQA
jgi:N-methylhydantoinase B